MIFLPTKYYGWLQGIQKIKKKRLVAKQKKKLQFCQQSIMVGLEQFLRRAVKKKKNKRTKIIIQPTKYYGWLRGKGRSGSSSVSD